MSLSEKTIVPTAVFLPCVVMLWQSNNIWDIFLKGLLNGIGCYVGISELIKQVLQPSKSFELYCKLYYKMAFILFKKKKSYLNVEKQNK